MHANFLQLRVERKLANISHNALRWIDSLDRCLLTTFVRLVIVLMETNMRHVFFTPLHFLLVVCYYDNKDPFDASRPFYLQMSHLNVITVGTCACVCVIITLTRPIHVSSFFPQWKITSIHSLSCCNTNNILFLIVIQWHKLKLLSIPLSSVVYCLSNRP